MRNALIAAYPGDKWMLKVKAMDNRQVVAIYKNMERTDRLTSHKRLKKEPGIKYCEQVTIWDLMEETNGS
jgi:hypothetical protein